MSSSLMKITDTASVIQTNPAYTIWKRQEHMLYSSMIGTLNIQPMVARSLTTRDIWLTLSSIYGKPFRGHVKQLKQYLKRSTKCTQSVTEYMREEFLLKPINLLSSGLRSIMRTYLIRSPMVLVIISEQLLRWLTVMTFRSHLKNFMRNCSTLKMPLLLPKNSQLPLFL